MTTRSLAAIFAERGRPLVVEEVDHGDPGPNEVVVAVSASGVCHSMLHRLHREGLFLPHLLGHEATGVVAEAGRAVRRVRAGDRVMVSWQPGVPGDAPPDITRGVTWRGAEARPSDVYTWSEHCRVDAAFVSPLAPDLAVAPTSVVGCA